MWGCGRVECVGAGAWARVAHIARNAIPTKFCTTKNEKHAIIL